MNRKLLAMALLFPLAAGCGNAETIQTQSASALPSAVSPASAKPTPVDPVELVISAGSLEAIRPQGGEASLARQRAQERLIESCMRTRGIAYVGRIAEIPSPDRTFWLTPPDEERAASQGFSQDEALPAGATMSPTPPHVLVALESEDPKSPGCRIMTAAEMNSKVRDDSRVAYSQLVNEFQAAQTAAIQSSPEVAAAGKRWVACLSAIGISGVKDRGELIRRFNASPSSPEAVPAAVADAKCSRSSGLFDAMLTESEKVVRSFVPARANEIRALQMADADEIAQLKALPTIPNS